MCERINRALVNYFTDKLCVFVRIDIKFIVWFETPKIPNNSNVQGNTNKSSIIDRICFIPSDENIPRKKYKEVQRHPLFYDKLTYRHLIIRSYRIDMSIQSV